MEFQTQYGPVKDGKLQPGGFKAKQPHKQSEETDVERAGYRTLKQQIQELEDSGKMLVEHLRARYPDPNRPIPPEPEPEPEPEPQEPTI